MAAIERRNVLDLIGKNRSKYHSCILTCYSLDFSFFEERVLPVLRTANIKNVNLLADGKFLEIAQDRTTGAEFKHNKTYNFHPVYTTGVFHPKIMLLTGTKHGLLIIGSGNITSSGLSTNDEIWGAFHLDNIDNENAPLFTEVWHYLQQFLKTTHGFIPQKIEWIKKYSPWLTELPKAKDEISLDSLNQTISFLTNSAEISTFQLLSKKIPKDNLVSITIISPYYDKQGAVIKELFDFYKPQEFNCILDIDFGLLPNDLDPAISKQINFYDWKSCKKDHTSNYYRLHAKMIHFQFRDGLEFMQLGSANATDAGMGTLNKKAINHEAGILIKRVSAVSWIKELEIILPKEKVHFNSIKFENEFNIESVSSLNHKVKLTYSELRGIEISIYAKEKMQISKGYIQIMSRQALVVEKLLFTIDGERIFAKCKNPDEVFKVCLVDDNDEIFSNYSIVHRFDALLRCNPDPNQEKLDSYLEQDYPDGEGVTELLTFIDHNWADENEPTRTSFKSSPSQDKEVKLAKDNFEKLSADKFNTVSDAMLLKQSGELSSANNKIAEFLGLISSGAFTKSDDDYKESEEQKLLEDKAQIGEGDDVPKSSKTKNKARTDKAAIARYFKKLSSFYYEELKLFYDSRALSVTPSKEITIKLLANILIALQLIQIFYGRKYSIEVEKAGVEQKEFYEESYLQEGELTAGCDTVKGFMIDVFGRFLLLATAGMKRYDYEILNQKLDYNRKQVLVKALFITLNLSWRPSELVYRDTLLLNALYFISPEKLTNAEYEIELKSKIEEQRLKSKHVAQSFSDNFSFFKGNLLPKYIKWFACYSDKLLRDKVIIDLNLLNDKSMIFNSKVGFNAIYRKSYQANCAKLDLLRAGYDWNEDESECLWEKITYGNKCVVFNV